MSLAAIGRSLFQKRPQRRGREQRQKKNTTPSPYANQASPSSSGFDSKISWDESVLHAIAKLAKESAEQSICFSRDLRAAEAVIRFQSTLELWFRAAQEAIERNDVAEFERLSDAVHRYQTFAKELESCRDSLSPLPPAPVTIDAEAIQSEPSRGYSDLEVGVGTPPVNQAVDRQAEETAAAELVISKKRVAKNALVGKTQEIKNIPAQRVAAKKPEVEEALAHGSSEKEKAAKKAVITKLPDEKLGKKSARTAAAEQIVVQKAAGRKLVADKALAAKNAAVAQNQVADRVAMQRAMPRNCVADVELSETAATKGAPAKGLLVDKLANEKSPVEGFEANAATTEKLAAGMLAPEKVEAAGAESVVTTIVVGGGDDAAGKVLRAKKLISADGSTIYEGLGTDDEDQFLVVCALCGATHVSNVDIQNMGMEFHCFDVGVPCESVDPDPALLEGHADPRNLAATTPLTSDERMKLVRQFGCGWSKHNVAKEIRQFQEDLGNSKEPRIRYRDGAIATYKGEKVLVTLKNPSPQEKAKLERHERANQRGDNADQA